MTSSTRIKNDFAQFNWREEIDQGALVFQGDAVGFDVTNEPVSHMAIAASAEIQLKVTSSGNGNDVNLQEWIDRDVTLVGPDDGYYVNSDGSISGANSLVTTVFVFNVPVTSLGSRHWDRKRG